MNLHFRRIAAAPSSRNLPTIAGTETGWGLGPAVFGSQPMALGPDTRYLTPATCLSLFSSTSPDEPSFSILLGPLSLNLCPRWPKARREGVPAFGNQQLALVPDTWYLTPATCLSLFSSTSPDEPSFSIYSGGSFHAICPRWPKPRRDGARCVRQPTNGAGA